LKVSKSVKYTYIVSKAKMFQSELRLSMNSNKLSTLDTVANKEPRFKAECAEPPQIFLMQLVVASWL
jgi:hypothetical protein